MAGFHPRDLIREIKCRPGIYDKDALPSPARNQRRLLWLEVAENLTPAEDWEQYSDVEKDARIDEIQAKWKHLKGHFYRELKLIDQGEAHKKRKYVYFDEMEFMKPHVGFKLTPMKYASHKSCDSVDDGSMYEEIVHHQAEEVEEEQAEDNVEAVNNSDLEMEALLKASDIIEEVQEDEEDEKQDAAVLLMEGRSLRPKRIMKSTAKAAQQNQDVSPPPLKKPKIEKDSLTKNSNMTKKASAPKASSSSTPGQNPGIKVRDGDISFSLSLVPTLRSLNQGKKLRAKIEILKVLHKYTDIVERSRFINNKSSHNQSNNDDNDPDMQEDHLEEFEDESGGVSVKHEANDPLNGMSGNTKTWWT